LGHKKSTLQGLEYFFWLEVLLKDQHMGVPWVSCMGQVNFIPTRTAGVPQKEHLGGGLATFGFGPSEEAKASILAWVRRSDLNPSLESLDSTTARESVTLFTVLSNFH
jgi:hypothetical protein